MKALYISLRLLQAFGFQSVHWICYRPRYGVMRRPPILEMSADRPTYYMRRLEMKRHVPAARNPSKLNATRGRAIPIALDVKNWLKRYRRIYFGDERTQYVQTYLECRHGPDSVTHFSRVAPSPKEVEVGNLTS